MVFSFYPYFIALGLTLLVELPIAALLGTRGRALLAVFCVNLFTHPLLHILLLVPADRHITITLYILEGVIAFGEGLLLRWILQEKSWRFVWISIVMNATSFGAGILFL